MGLIEKTTPDTSSFEERMRQAEQEAGVPPDEELYAEFGVHPEPDETGRVPTARAEEETVEAEPEPEAEEVPEAPEPVVEASEPEPEPDKLGELNDKLGRLLNENAELRRQIAEQPDPAEQMQEWLTQAQAAQQGQYTPDQFEQLVEDDPATATMLAHERGDQLGYARAWHAWNQASPGAPQIWADNQQLRAQLKEFQEGIAQQIAPARAAANQQELLNAMSTVAARHDDYAEVMGTLDETAAANLVAKGLPKEALEHALAAGDQKAKEGVYETLYRWQKAERADQLVQAAREAPAQQAEEARQAKLEAHVGSAATTTPEPVEETEGERQVRVWNEQFPTVRGAWKGQESRR